MMPGHCTQNHNTRSRCRSCPGSVAAHAPTPLDASMVTQDLHTDIHNAPCLPRMQGPGGGGACHPPSSLRMCRLSEEKRIRYSSVPTTRYILMMAWHGAAPSAAYRWWPGRRGNPSRRASRAYCARLHGTPSVLWCSHRSMTQRPCIQTQKQSHEAAYVSRSHTRVPLAVVWMTMQW